MKNAEEVSVTTKMLSTPASAIQQKLSAEDFAMVRDALLLGLDALGELHRLTAHGVGVMNPDPNGTGVGQIAGALRIIG